MHVWDAAGSGAIHFDCTDLGEENLGHIIENWVIRAALLERLADHANVTVHHGVRPQALERDADGVTLRHAGGTFRGRLAVGADGARSWVRDQAQVALDSHDYGHIV